MYNLVGKYDDNGVGDRVQEANTVIMFVYLCVGVCNIKKFIKN